MGTELVFSVMDFVVGGLLMIVTFIWFRSKHIARFYDACKVGSVLHLGFDYLYNELKCC